MRSIWQDDEIPAGEPLWRYFKLEHFTTALRSGALHFASATQFNDPFEGATAIVPPGSPVDSRFPELHPAERAFEQLRRLTKVCCWHRSEYECSAMWNLYALNGKGVALRTTKGRLGAALRPFRLAAECGEEVPYWGEVRYLDLSTHRLNVSLGNTFFHKHLAFESEREFRVAISLEMAQEFIPIVPELGIDVLFDPAVLIEAVFCGPGMSSDDCAELVHLCGDTGLAVAPRESILRGRPRYT